MGFLYSLILFLSSVFLSAAALALYRRLPAEWLCDFEECTSLLHAPVLRCRNRGRTWMAMALAWTAVCFTAGGWKPGTAADRVFLAAAFVVLMAAALSDRDYRVIPDQSCAALLLLALARALFPGGASAGQVFYGMMLASGLVLLSMLLSLAVTRRPDSVGMGDLKLMGAAGACVAVMNGSEWMPAVTGFYMTAVLSSAAWFAVLLLFRRSCYGDFQPMGPWIAGSALFFIAAGI